MSKISFEGVVALKRAGLVSTFRTVYSARLQENGGSKPTRVESEFECKDTAHDQTESIIKSDSVKPQSQEKLVSQGRVFTSNLTMCILDMMLYSRPGISS